MEIYLISVDVFPKELVMLDYYCCLFLDFRGSILNDVKFIGCNIKTADFRKSDLTNATIKNCSVESTMFKGAKTNNLTFKENYCFDFCSNYLFARKNVDNLKRWYPKGGVL